MAVARTPQGLAAGTLLAAMLPLFAAAQAEPEGPVQRGRHMTEWLLRGQVDSLYPRMSRGFQSSIGGRAGLAKFLERVGALGSEVGDPREVVYRESAGTYYYRIARFQRAPSVTTYMIWDSTGAIQGLLVQPTPVPAPSDFTARQTRTPLRLPFDGQAYVAWGGREPHQNYHVEFRDQRYASDFFLLEDGKVHRGTGARNEDYACFGRPILAPAAGTVRAAVDSVADNEPGRMNPKAPPGNYAIVEHGKGEFSLLAHLRQGSLRVRAGTRVEAGDTLGLCGNSGNSSAPHLHYHLQSTGRAGNGLGLPAQFLDYRADGEEVERGEPVRGQTIEAPERDSRLTLARIFDSSEFDAEYLGPVRWIEGHAAYARLEPDATGARSLVRYDAATGRREIWVAPDRLVPPGDSAPLLIEDYAVAPDGARLLIFTNTRKVWRYHTRGDYWVLDLAGGALRKLGGPAKEATLMFAKFSPDGGRVGYVREHDLYVEDLRDGGITRLTRDGSATTINGTFDWVYEEELSLRDGWRWSPDGRRIAFWQLDASGVGDFHLVNNTDSIYSRVIAVQYPKAGTTNSAARVGVVPAAGGDPVWLQVPGDPRNNYIARMDWAASPDEILIQHLNRAQNTIQLMLAEATTGAVRTILTERDDAWLDVVDDVVWLDGGREFTWVSERDGWRHVYRVSRDGGRVRPVTKGGFDVIEVETVDQRGGWLYYVASPDDPGQRYLYRSRLDGSGRPERLTPTRRSGWHAYDASGDARWAVHTWSSFGQPPVTDVVRLPGHEVRRTLVDNRRLREALARLALPRPSFFKVDASPGVRLDGWLMRPADFDSTRRYPVLFHVYGEPAGQTVTDNWGGDEYLWHAMLTQLGYVVASVDNRGTPAPRGRAFRKAAYKKIGVISSADQVAAAEAIRTWPGIDSSRVGVWGWSGGGSTTLNLMFRYPGRYRMGMSVAPVPDQRLYDTIYQERFMGLPQDNAAAYREGSPITYAHRLRGDLLLVHGTGDDNVHFQGSERLINALVSAGRPFTLMAYPNRSHCICEGKGTQLHLYGLLTRYLTEHLPAGPR